MPVYDQPISCPPESEDGQLPDTVDKPKQMEDMNYRETVRSVRSFMGWNHIPTLRVTFPSLINRVTHGKARTPRGRLEYL